MMFLKVTKAFGKPICAVLYAVFAAMAAKKKPLPLAILLALHLMEYFTKGRWIAAEHGLSPAEGFAQCLAFGFTWWLPLKKE
jgi:hypothetical protein